MANESFRKPPLVLADGRLIVFAHGEYQAFYGPKSCSWTTGTLDGRDVAELRKYMPTLEDNVTHMWEDTK